MNTIVANQCPCCLAPLSPNQSDECKIVCSHCGAEIIVKLPLDVRIEKMALKRVSTGIFPFCSLLGSVLTFWIIFYLIWRFLRIFFSQLNTPFVLYYIFIPTVLVISVMYTILLLCTFSGNKRLAEECNWSVAKLEFLAKNQPTGRRKRMLKDVKRQIKKSTRDSKCNTGPRHGGSMSHCEREMRSHGLNIRFDLDFPMIHAIL